MTNENKRNLAISRLPFECLVPPTVLLGVPMACKKASQKLPFVFGCVAVRVAPRPLCPWGKQRGREEAEAAAESCLSERCVRGAVVGAVSARQGDSLWKAAPGHHSDVHEQCGALSHCSDRSQARKLPVVCAKCLCGVTLLGDLVSIPVSSEDTFNFFT